VIVIKENKTSLPMMYLSRHIRKEAVYDNSQKRAQMCYKYISSGLDYCHEKISHGPLFSHQSRRKRWSAWYSIVQALLMALEPYASLKDRFENARHCLIGMFPNERRPGRSYQGFVKARRNITSGLMTSLKEHLQDQLRPVSGKFRLRLGWEAVAVDGSRVETPRTRPNEEAFGCAGKKKTGPQLSITTLYHMGTGLPWDWRIGRGTESERVHLRSMLPWLEANALLVADAGFTGYELLKDIIAAGRHFLVRVGSNITLLNDLGLESKIDGNIVWLWPENRQPKQPPLKLRLIVLENTDRSKTPVYLLTDVFDKQRLSDETAGVLYRMRWGVEVFYRSFKQTLDQHKLRSRSPQQAKDELEWAMIAYLLMGLMSVETLICKGIDPLHLSVATALRVIRAAMGNDRMWRRKGDIRVLLSAAVKDDYRRKSSKKARSWPFKKKEKICGVPKIRKAKPTEILYAKRLYDAA
jgi:hypothetical protein